MVKSLFDLSLEAVCLHRVRVDLGYLPTVCKHRLLDYLSSHDRLSAVDSGQLVKSALFGMNLTSLNFYLSDEITDPMLVALTEHNKFLERITLIECRKVTDKGLQSVTRSQFGLQRLELRSMSQITDEGLSLIKSPQLHTVDISGCNKVTSEGLREFLSWNRNICALYLNYCTGLDEHALYHIGDYVGENLRILELDFLGLISESALALQNLCQACPKLNQLSLAKFFQYEEMADINPYTIDGLEIKDIDLYGNFFVTLPRLPPTLTHIRLSVSGDEDEIELLRSLEQQPFLQSINLVLNCREESIQAIDKANNLLATILPFFGDKITILQVAVARLFDDVLVMITSNCVKLTHLALDVKHLSNFILQKYFSGSSKSSASHLLSLKICHMRLSYRVLFAIARGARHLTDLETSYMYSVDDRFLALLADNSKSLRCVNFNGCKWVSDKGLIRLAKRCPLREVRIRGTACTDRSLHILGQFCPQLEWISYADYSGKPKFTDEALATLKNACISRFTMGKFFL